MHYVANHQNYLQCMKFASMHWVARCYSYSMHTIVILRTLHESLALCTSYAAACESGDDKDAKVEWNQKDTVLPIGLALTEFHCILLFRDK